MIYAPDEFDVADVGTGRRGAHRAKANPLVSAVPVVLVLLAVLAVAAGAFTLLDQPGSRPGPAALPAPIEPAPIEPAPIEPAPTDAAPTGPSAGPTADVPTSSPQPEPTVDLSLPLVVLNGTRTKGLAASAGELLTRSGFTVARVDNYRGIADPSTTVFYPDPDQQVTAEAVVDALGLGVAELDPDQDGLTVVLGKDYAP